MTTLDARIREQVAHAYTHAPAIRQIMDDAGVTPDDIQTAADLARIPVTSKDRLVEIHAANPPFGGFLAVDVNTLPRIYISPGPIYDPQPYDETVAQGTQRAFRSVGFGPGDRVLNTFMYHLTPAGLLLDEAIRGLGATVIPSGPGNTDLQIQMMVELQVTGFAGTPSYLATIIDRAHEMGIAPEEISIKKALFTAEPYPPSLRRRFEGDYGMNTVSAYGTADLGFVGYEASGMHGFCIVDHVYMQICDPGTGEVLPDGEMGEIVVTTFNRGYPLVRFGTGDLGILRAEPEADCPGRQQLVGLFGRAGDAIKVRGMFLHPNQLQSALKRFPEIKRAQAFITRPENRDVVTLCVELQPGADPSQLGDHLKKAVQDAIRLKIDEVQVVEPGGIDPSQRMVVDQREWR